MFSGIRGYRPQLNPGPRYILPFGLTSPARTTFCRVHSLRPQRHPRIWTLRRSAVDPVSFLVAAALSLSIAYVATGYLDSAPRRAHPAGKDESHTTLESGAGSAPQSEPPAMVSQLPPDRPGTLTSDHEAKLKDMWAATLDVFGVSHEPAQTNGAGEPSSTADSSEGKKKRKNRLSLFGKKRDKDSGGGAAEGGDDNDKHGQAKEFQQALASQSPEQLRDAFWNMVKHDHPDALLLRFLRARKWDVHAALVMLISTMHWRSQDVHVDDDIMLRGEEHALRECQSSNAEEKKEGEDFMAQLRMGKSFLHGQDQDGRPCCYVRVRLHRQGEQSEKSLERFTVYTIETARLLLKPPVDTATIVFDMTDFSMANMDYTPVKFMIKCFEANYPESLGSVLVYKSPWLFQGIWKIIKGWLDPVVASKVHFASNVDDLQQWIPRGRIMKELGGDEDYTYTYVEPREGENAALADPGARDRVLQERTELVKSYEAETLAWVHGEDAGQGRGRLAQRLAENYWKLDPFVRARSLYDRTGVLQAGGKLDFYPTTSGGATTGGDEEVD